MVRRIPLSEMTDATLSELYDRLDAMDRAVSSTAEAALRHQSCHSRLIHQLRRAEEAEKDNDRYEEAVGELNEHNIHLQRRAVRAELLLDTIRSWAASPCPTRPEPYKLDGEVAVGYVRAMSDVSEFLDGRGWIHDLYTHDEDVPSYAGHPDNGQDARAELLNIFASWGFTTRFGSRKVVDSVLEKHRQELEGKGKQ